jgi:hypothetical protein
MGLYHCKSTSQIHPLRQVEKRLRLAQEGVVSSFVGLLCGIVLIDFPDRGTYSFECVPEICQELVVTDNIKLFVPDCSTKRASLPQTRLRSFSLASNATAETLCLVSLL